MLTARAIDDTNIDLAILQEVKNPLVLGGSISAFSQNFLIVLQMVVYRGP